MFRTTRSARPGTRPATRSAAAVLAGAAALAVVALPATEADAVTTCAANCITNLETQRGGLSMSTTFDTTVPTTDTLTVYRAGNQISRTSSGTPSTKHKLTTPQQLAANTAYNWHLVVTDSAGNVQERTGDLTTLHRRVTVQFVTDTVTNDSDSGGSGEFATWTGLDSAVAVPLLVPEDIDSGQTVPMGGVMQKIDAGSSVAVHTQMEDTDISSFVLVPAPVDMHWSKPRTTWDNGTSPAHDWASANGTLDTHYATTMKPFQIQVNSFVGFVVRGYYSVDFAA